MTEREFMDIVRRALLMVVQAIETKWGFHPSTRYVAKAEKPHN